MLASSDDMWLKRSPVYIHIQILNESRYIYIYMYTCMCTYMYICVRRHLLLLFVDVTCSGGRMAGHGHGKKVSERTLVIRPQKFAT